MIVVLVIFAVSSILKPHGWRNDRLVGSIRHIAGGDLVKPIGDQAPNEMGATGGSLRHMRG